MSTKRPCFVPTIELESFLLRWKGVVVLLRNTEELSLTIIVKSYRVMIRSYRATVTRELDRIKNPTKIYSKENIPEEIRKRLENKENNRENGESFETPSSRSVKELSTTTQS